MILKTYYNFPARQALVISPTVQPDDMMWRHQDGEHSPLEQTQVSEEEENVFADGALSTNKAGEFISQTEVEMDHETSQVAARHFELGVFRQQGTTAKSTDWGRHYPAQADFGGNPTATPTRVAGREEAAIGWHQRGTTSTEQD